MSSSRTDTHVDVTMPQMGVSVAEGTVVEWRKQAGDWVQRDEVIADRGFEDLDGPVRRVATPDVPIPFSPPLEQALLPSVDRVKEVARELLEY